MNSKFLDNNYTEEYFLLISLAGTRTIDPNLYYENHHIVPKSLNGGNETNNLVNLTPKEHFRAHQLLTEMTTGKDKSCMIYAFWTMANVQNQYQGNRYIPTPEEYEEAVLKRRALEITNETRTKISESRKGKIAVYNPTLDKLKYIECSDLDLYLNNGFENRGRPKPEYQKQKISATNKRKGIVPKSIGWSKGLTKDTSDGLKQISIKNKGKVPHNKGKSNIDLYGEEKAKELLEKNKTKCATPLIINGISYSSIIEASRQLKITERRAKKLGLNDDNKKI